MADDVVERLQQEVERLSRINSEICRQHNALVIADARSAETVTTLRAELTASCQREEELQAQVAAMRGALEFYADPFNRKDDGGDSIPVPDFYSELNFGDRAQEALSAVPANAVERAVLDAAQGPTEMDDPARSIAGLMGRATDDEKAAFNMLIKAALLMDPAPLPGVQP